MCLHRSLTIIITEKFEKQEKIEHLFSLRRIVNFAPKAKCVRYSSVENLLRICELARAERNEKN